MNLVYVKSETYDPYYNLGLEKYLFDTVLDDEVIMYLWQNEKTVVCGRNQNVFKECNLSNLNMNDGSICRRLSGGGAVFHDLGNLNFTFIAKDKSYDLDKQLSVILNACKSFGINAIKTGRNDLTVDGKKFSGNAFYKADGRQYHHGTIMINVNAKDLDLYLNVDREKLKGKGVDSVKSRVTNLTDFCNDITVDNMTAALCKAFEDVYVSTYECFTPTRGAKLIIEGNKDFFEDPDFIYGKRISFTNQMSKRFTWGNADINFSIQNGIIKETVIYSDSLVPEFILNIQDLLRGIHYRAEDICAIIDKASSQFGASCRIPCNDLKELINNSI